MVISWLLTWSNMTSNLLWSAVPDRSMLNECLVFVSAYGRVGGGDRGRGRGLKRRVGHGRRREPRPAAPDGSARRRRRWGTGPVQPRAVPWPDMYLPGILLCAGWLSHCPLAGHLVV